MNNDQPIAAKHSHYYKDVSNLDSIDVYRVCQLFNITDQAIGHALKKLLVSGGRGAGKSMEKDIQEAIDSLQRWQAMRAEDQVSIIRSNEPLPLRFTDIHGLDDGKPL